MHSDEKEEFRKEALKCYEKHCDKSNPDQLATSKIRFILRGIGFEPKTDDVKVLVNEFDKDKNGYITKDDFIKIVNRKFDERGTNDEISKAFEMFDSEKRGKISFLDLKRVADELGENITDEELHEMIREADKNNDDFVDKQEFLEIMKKTALY